MRGELRRALPTHRIQDTPAFRASEDVKMSRIQEMKRKQGIEFFAKIGYIEKLPLMPNGGYTAPMAVR